jgi:hypothetical protein
MERTNMTVACCGALLVLLLVGAAVLFLGFTRFRVELRNASGRGIDKVEVKCCDRVLTFADVAPGAVVAGSFEIAGESEWIYAQGTLDDGTELRGKGEFVDGKRLHQRMVIVLGGDGMLSWKQVR